MAKSVNPATLKLIKNYKDFSPQQINDVLEKADEAAGEWKKISFKKRRDLFNKLGKYLKANAKENGKIISDEMGKLYKDSIAEINKCALACEYFAENGENFLKNIEIESEFAKSYVHFEPLGVILAVMPWNFPLWQAYRAAIPAIMAGNTMILKHSSNVSGCALMIQESFEKAGFSKNVFQAIIAPGNEIDKIIGNEIIKGVTFTGSTDVGKKIATTAGTNLKKCVLELGGNDPYIVLESANIELAAKKCAESRLLNAGQSCIAAKRFIVSAAVYDEFIESFVKNMEKAKFGDPYMESVKIGPLVSIAARDEIHETVMKYNQAKAVKILTGGFVPEIKGAFYPPTVLEVLNAEKIEDREIFGPVAMVFKAKNDDDAIQIANKTSFGLGAAIFSKNLNKALELAETKVEAGSVFINDFVKSDPRMPFGGIKQSGYGRELSEFGIREFTNIKTIVAG